MYGAVFDMLMTVGPWVILGVVIFRLLLAAYSAVFHGKVYGLNHCASGLLEDIGADHVPPSRVLMAALVGRCIPGILGDAILFSLILFFGGLLWPIAAIILAAIAICGIVRGFRVLILRRENFRRQLAGEKPAKPFEFID